MTRVLGGGLPGRVSRRTMLAGFCEFCQLVVWWGGSPGPHLAEVPCIPKGRGCACRPRWRSEDPATSFLLVPRWVSWEGLGW